jgi:hypothetical protein
MRRGGRERKRNHQVTKFTQRAAKKTVNEEGVLTATHNRWLPVWFVGYTVGVGVLYLSIPWLFGLRYTMPWDYWWIFLVVTPHVAVGLLTIGVRSGRFSGWGVLLFYLASIALGLWLGWFSYQLAGVV